MKQIGSVERGRRQPFQHLDRIAHVQAHIFEIQALDMAQRSDDAVEKRLASDEAVPRSRSRLTGEMLAGPEADLQFKRAAIAEQVTRVQRTAGADGDLRHQALK